MKKTRKILIALLIILIPLLVASLVLYFKTKDRDKVTDYSEHRPEILEEFSRQEGSVGYYQPSDEKGPDGENTNQPEVDYLADTKAINPDTVAWVTIDNTNIDYPVVQTDNNEFYLHNNFYKKYEFAGVPFLDCRCEKEFTGFNSILYGHFMADKSMFANVNRFKRKQYFDEHTTGSILLSDGVHKIHIFAVIVLPYDGFIYETVFLTSADKERFAKTLKDKSLFYREPEVDITKTGVITLSTCSYEYDNARTAIIGYIDK